MVNGKEQIQGWMNTDDEFLIAIDPNGIILRVNQAWLDFCTAHDVTESLWKTGGNYFEPLERTGKEKEIQSLKQVLANEKNEHTQTCSFPLKNGDIQWLHVKVRGIQGTSGHSRGAIVYHRPLTLHSIQPITAEIILESMTEGFFLLDDHLNMMYINGIGEELLQCKERNVVGQGFLEGFAEATNTLFHLHYERALKEKVVVEFVDYYRPLDTWFQVKAYPLKKGGLAVYFQDVSERKKTEELLVESAYYDYLTGLPNRRLLTQTTRSLVEQGKELTVFYLKIDNLNFINAVHHYNVGDDVMKNIALKLTGLLDESCHIARMDGNEFIILKETGPDDDLSHCAEQIQWVFRQPITLEDSQKINVTASIGIACYPVDSPKMDEVYSYAEMAMEESKIMRNFSYTFFHPRMKITRDRRLAIEESLAGDLTENGFYYTLQPQIDGVSGEIVGAEVLSRWAHPELGELSPLEFIQVAEETGDIVRLTGHLLREVFAQIKNWENGYGWKLRTAINMTPSLLSNADFFDRFIALMDHYEIDPAFIEIEITEQAELTYSPKTLENLLLCKSKGISIAIDDFGTGFSMIAYLTQFPINKIKIDRSFVQKIGQDRKSEAVLKSLIHLAKSIECELLAEGVERTEEADFLRTNDCHIYQGYLYDRPLKVADFEAKYVKAGHKFLIRAKQ